MSAELVLAVVAGADLCLKYGKTLIQAYKDFRDARQILSERILVVESIWSRISLQIKFVKRVAKTMGREHCAIHIEVFEMLHSKQTRAISKIESLINEDGGIKKWHMPFLRASLDDTVQQLETWQRIFDPTWYLILRIADTVIDRELEDEQQGSGLVIDQSISFPKFNNLSALTSKTLLSAENLRKEGLNWNEIETLLYSTTKIVRRQNSSKRYVLNSIDCTSGINVTQARTDTESLAKKLGRVDSDAFGLLSAYGLVKRKRPGTTQIQSLNLVFSLPTDAGKPRSLRQDLMQPQSFSLSRILDLARRLAGAISFVHTCDFVHKNIRPETIISFGNHSAPKRGPVQTYLLGFDSFRNVNFHTLHRGDAAWERDLYRHPSRQGLFAQDNYVMQHDVYSLGVCLLEIGLWNSFVDYDPADRELDDIPPKPKPSTALGMQIEDFEPKSTGAISSYNHVKDHLVALATSKLPLRMGDKYTSVVVTCLTCLDEGNEDFGDDKEMQDEDGILVGVRFIEKVLLRLNEISL
ncbi:hypothetical protein BJ166DRAFT_469912 [Pestalotiopsis sp. NC0098]|nr:hypothetical protein BJ166DRAFT_469912 [Pestalotiopsis sp. NC0098]